ncbi:MAG: ABC transporter permease subunit [Anaerolineae bacterium]|nr:ABC transporter permease subunit [Anaerolineae bacterium]
MIPRVRAIVLKEWADVFRNRIVVLLVALPPTLMVVLSIGVMYATVRFPTADLEDMRPFLQRPDFAGLTEMEAAQVVMAQYFLTLFLLMPLIIPVSIAAYSIVGEKLQRSLEPLLATPVETGELLLAKCLAAVTPALAVTWTAFAVFVAGARLLAVSDQAFSRMVSPVWVLMVMLIAPLVAALGVLLSIIASSRLNDPRAVEQGIGVLVIPVIGLFIAQMTGVLTLNYLTLALGAVALAAADALMLRAAVRLFERETILTRWR